MRCPHGLSIPAIRTIHTHPTSGKRAIGTLINVPESGPALMTKFLFLDVWVPELGADVAMTAKGAHIRQRTAFFDLAVSDYPVELHWNGATTTLTRFPFCLVHRTSRSRTPLPRCGQLVIPITFWHIGGRMAKVGRPFCYDAEQSVEHFANHVHDVMPG